MDEKQKTKKTERSSAQYHLTQAEHNGAVEHALDLPKLWAIVQKNWMVLKGDSVRLFPLFVMPLVMIVIFGYAAGNLPKHLPTAVADYDHSTLSQEVIAQLSAMEAFSIQYQVGTQDEAKRLLDAQEVKVLFVIPPGFGDSVERGEPAAISLMVDESDSSVAQSAKASAQAFLSQLSQTILTRRLSQISARAASASRQLALERAQLAPIASFDSAAQHGVDERARQSAQAAAKSSAAISAQTILLQNSLGFLVDQNQIADSFTPAAVGGASIIELATGDAQAATLSQIAFYKGMKATQSALAANTRTITAQYDALAGQSRAQAASAKVAISLQDAAGRQMEFISSEAGSSSSPSPVVLQVLQPYGYGRRGIDFLLPAILALIIFQGATMGLGRAIAGERQDGSMTRVFLTPTSNLTIIVGTQVFYMLLETVRSSLVIFVAMALFGVTISGHLVDLVVIIALFAMGATGVGMVLSVLAKTQEQYLALGMLVSMPMMFLSGAFFPVQTMPPILQSMATFLPVTYAADAMRGVMVKGFMLHQLVPDLVALMVFGLFTFALSLMLFKREIA